VYFVENIEVDYDRLYVLIHQGLWVMHHYELYVYDDDDDDDVDDMVPVFAAHHIPVPKVRHPRS
jgi:hypothetical protein